MPRKKLQDITPPSNGKSIRNISLEHRAARTRRTRISAEGQNDETPVSIPIHEELSQERPAPHFDEMHQEIESHVAEAKAFEELSPSRRVRSDTPLPPVTLPQSFFPPENPRERTGGRMKIFLWTAGVAFVALLGFVGFEKFFYSATVSVTPKALSIELSEALAADASPQEGGLKFENMAVSKEAAKTVPETGSKKVEQRASGKLTIYNDYSKASQRLIRNTRFQTPAGLIYRIDDSVVVPGQQIQDGKILPGSIEVVVYADAAGEEYNIGPATFTIPGFKDDPRYEKFSAKSSGSMTGGYVGTIKTASKADVAKARDELEASLKQELFEMAKAQMPQNFISFSSLQYPVFELLSAPESSEVKVRGTLNSILFDQEMLAMYLAKKKIPTLEDGARVSIENLGDLSVVPDPEEVIPWKTGHLPFTISGTARFRWLFDEEALKRDLGGKQKTMVPMVLEGYPGVDRASVSIRPFWKQSLPKSVESIKIIYSGDSQ